MQRVGYVTSEITKHGGIVVCSLIAPYAQARDKARELVELQGSYVEVHVSTPLEICEQRDVKGLYEKARKGLINGFTGIDDPYEEPIRADVAIDTSTDSPEIFAQKIIDYLVEENKIVLR